MKTSRYSPEQIAMALRQADAGTPVEEICRKLGVSEPTFYRWKKRFGSLGVPEVRELRQLREENHKLKQLVADLTLDKHLLREALGKRY
jgi:putative transposase